jgi:hypothetical protein
MDENTPQAEGVSGQVPPVDSGTGQAPPWDQQPPAAGDQAPVADQAAAGAQGQEAAAEYAAWSSDATYQNPDPSGHPAAQAPDASTAFVAPEPQAVTYQEQPPQDQQPLDPQQQQAYEQQQAGYDPQQQQQAYEQQYAQQQAQYAQQQQAYEQYQQQQQAYEQQQAGYDPQQQPGYNPQQPGQDQAAYGQQQGYYQQPQQGYQQQQYQQPAQPYAYAQPNQQGWPADPNYWDQDGAGYGRSFLAVLAGFVLVTWGVMLMVGGGLLMFLDDVSTYITDANLGPETQALVDDAIVEQTAAGGVLLMLGILMAIGAVGIWAHRGWGRATGILLGLLGTVLGIGMVASSIAFEIGDVTIDGALAGEAEPLGAALVVLVSFLIVLLGMFVGKRHFRKKGVTAPA